MTRLTRSIQKVSKVNTTVLLLMLVVVKLPRKLLETKLPHRTGTYKRLEIHRAGNQKFPSLMFQHSCCYCFL